jgi:2-polyprenyl-3-methyl-5-hydroxy-6-metoxy-1,4-benzoquinol methylase/glycosyltransferase involved in cell wall biosynthesis
MKLAYFSPLAPQRSGISDYSEELLPYLAAAAEITLFVDGFQPSSASLNSTFEVRDYRRRPQRLDDLDRFDAVLYHMGNDHRYHTGICEALRQQPGIVVFHDFALQDFFLGLARTRGDLRIYLDEVGACHGESARAAAAESLSRGGTPSLLARPVDFPLNCRLARAAEGIIVHSDWSRTRLQEIAPEVPVRCVRHHVTSRAAADKSCSMPSAAPVRIASFGLINPDKGIERALRALAKLRHEYDFRYTLVGEPNGYYDVRALVRRYGLEDRVEITGHVTLEEFERRISETDIALNLRERTVGETSGSLCRLMAAGVTAIVSDEGWFGELPDDAVVKVEASEYSDELLHAFLKRLITDRNLREQIGANARAYTSAKHSIEQSAAGYLSFITEIVAARQRRRLLSGVSAELSALGVSFERDPDFMREVAVEVAALAPPEIFRNQVLTSSNSQRPNGNEPNGHSRSSPDPKAPPQTASALEAGASGRLPKIEGIDYKRAAREYPARLDAELRHYLLTKPFYNLANKPPSHTGEGMDAETFRHFCDFANMAVTLSLPAGSRILDVGCSTGWLSEYFARLGYIVKGIDISPDFIQMSRERIAGVPYDVDHETPLRCEFEVHDIEASPLPEKFDAVICYDSLHHFEDEHAVMRNLAAMMEIGGSLFILEGQRPSSGSVSEAELRDVMEELHTLESPFDYTYLRKLLDDHGFALVGDYVSVNGLFDREMIEDNRLPLRTVPTNYHYLACKKVTDGSPASNVPDSRNPGVLRARLALTEEPNTRLAPGETLELNLEIENTGDTLWLAGREPRAGVVMPAMRISDDTATLVSEIHGQPVLPHAVAPGETVRLKIAYEVPERTGRYIFKLDLVCQHVCWFAERGSQPLVIHFEVVSEARA